jgi:shikimate dehydrogenase
MEAMEWLNPLARQLGVINTVYRNRERGKVTGDNTDADAIVQCLAAAGHPATAQVLVLGAGGVAQAAACCLAWRGATVAIHNRTHARAQELAQRCGANAQALDADQVRQFDYQVLINGTSVGMNAPDDTPWPFPHRPGTTVFDTVYKPRDTRLLREARAAGCRVIEGLEMFARQAAEQQQLWTGKGGALVPALMKQLEAHFPR